jgi:hypothetical protein
MCCVPTDRAALAAGLVLGLIVSGACARAGGADLAPEVIIGQADLAPEAIIRRADRSRGLGTPYRFLAHIYGDDATAGERRSNSRSANDTVVEIRSDGFAKQLIVVLEPSRGDVLLKAEDTIWLRPRRLHRLTRIPPDLRIFNGAATADVTTVDLLKTYAVTGHRETCPGDGEYVLDLVASHDGVRYPRACYRVTCEAVPRRIDFMAASGKVLKTIEYADFADVLGARIATRLVIEDHIFHDVSIVAMSAFARLDPDDVALFSPDYLLAMPDQTTD